MPHRISHLYPVQHTEQTNADISAQKCRFMRTTYKAEPDFLFRDRGRCLCRLSEKRRRHIAMTVLPNRSGLAIRKNGSPHQGPASSPAASLNMISQNTPPGLQNNVRSFKASLSRKALLPLQIRRELMLFRRLIPDDGSMDQSCSFTGMRIRR